MNIRADTAASTVTLDIRGTFTADQLRQVLQRIADARAQIAQDPPQPDGLRLDLSGNVRWYSELLAVDHTVSMLLVCLRGFGWHGITLDADSRAALIHTLMLHTSIAIDGPGPVSGLQQPN